MDISNLVPDDAVLAELGQRIAQRRIDAGLTQAALAEQAGVSKSTVERFEAGASTQLGNVVRILRALDLLANLEQLVPAAGPGPMALLKQKGKRRQRASSLSSADANKPAEPWSWDDDT